MKDGWSDEEAEARVAGRSTAPRGRVTTSGGGVMEETRRRCMKAKALQTIVTLYMTSSCYNNTAVIYCTVQERLNIWLDKADRRHLTSSMNNISSALILLFFFFFLLSQLFVFAHKQYMDQRIYIPWTQCGKKRKEIKHKKTRYKTYKSEFWWGAFILYIQIQFFFFFLFLM